MAIIESQTELTTAITDLILAVECLILFIWWRRQPNTDRMRRTIWSLVLGLLGTVSLLGAIAHGLQMSLSVNELLWKPIYLILGILVAFFLVGAIHDWLGQHISRRCIPWALGLGCLLFIFTELYEGLFLVFIVYEAVVMISALIIYLYLAGVKKRCGAAVMATAILVNLLAAGVQASDLSLTLGVPFDHNGLFHLIQMVALVLLGRGLYRWNH